MRETRCVSARVGVEEGGLVVEIVIFMGSYFHCRAARGHVELGCSKSLSTGLVLPTADGGPEQGCPFPSCRQFSGCEPRSICRALLGQLLPRAPLPHSVQLVLTAAPQKPGSPTLSALPCPGSATCNPPLPLGLPGRRREASPISASWQSLCMAASARPSRLGM